MATDYKQTSTDYVQQRRNY